MNRWLCLILTAALLLGLCPAAMAEAAPVYQLGDKIADFTVTLSDGATVSLYGLLAEKKAVLINLWASWCGPCKREFPAMQQAYDNYSEDVGILALSDEPTDTDEILLAMREELGLTTIPVGLDTAKLADRVGLTSYPTSVLVDRNGVICLIRPGSVPDAASFERLFDVFLAEDYAEPVLLTDLPRDPGPAKRPAEELRAALGVADERIAVRNIEDEEGVWPFYAAEDGSCIRASNDAQQYDTYSGFSVTVAAQAGQALAYDYAVTGQDYIDALWVYVDKQPANLHSGVPDWRTGLVAFETAGEHTVHFIFNRFRPFVPTEGAEARVGHMRLIDAEEAAALRAAEPAYPKTLAGKAIEVEVAEGELKQARIHDANGQVDEIIDVLQGDSFTHRLRVGTEVDPSRAFLHCDGVYHTLSNLPYDTEGFLLRHDGAEPLNPNLTPYHYVSPYVDAFAENHHSVAFVTWANSEAEADVFMGYLAENYENTKHTAIELTWEYTDGSPKQSGESADAAPGGMSRYAFTVQDESGAPVAGVMLQICSDSTCAAVTTDENGTAVHEAAPYPYEIHVLKAPEGYAADAEVYAMPEAGGSLTITLKKP